jgi:hypothetical protein
MIDYPIKSSHPCFSAANVQQIVSQLEETPRNRIPVRPDQTTLAASRAAHSSLPFYVTRGIYTRSNGQWSWKATDDKGREIVSGVLHDRKD